MTLSLSETEVISKSVIEEKKISHIKIRDLILENKLFTQGDIHPCAKGLHEGYALSLLH